MVWSFTFRYGGSGNIKGKRQIVATGVESTNQSRLSNTPFITANSRNSAHRPR